MTANNFGSERASEPRAVATGSQRNLRDDPIANAPGTDTTDAVSIRPALESDIESLCSLDEIAKQSPARSEFIRRAVAGGTCYVAVIDQDVVGYSVLNYAFYDHGFVDMLYVAGDYRRRGVGSSLLEHMERLCKTAKLFTSTNLSNLPMQALLTRRGYFLSGVIHNLDEGDPEVVYFKPCQYPER